MFFYESGRYGESDVFSFSFCENLTFPLHLHRCFEWIYVLEGQLESVIDQDRVTLGPGEMVMIFPHQMHSYITPESSRGILCIFAPEHVSLFATAVRNKKQLHPVTRLSHETDAYLLGMIRQSEGNPYRIKSLLYALCAEISSTSVLTDRCISRDHALQHRILTLIEEHYTEEELSLQSISSKLGYHYQYLSRFFNNQFKMSFPEMLNTRRVAYAAHLLRNTGRSITEIALCSGFANIRSFNRNFLQFIKTSPGEYRRIAAAGVTGCEYPAVRYT